MITAWYDRNITAGTEWAGEIDQHLNTASVILLLISADFLASDYCYAIELTRAMERHEDKEARVIPVILREVDWKGAPFGKLEALPKKAKPVTNWENRDAAFADVARGIRKAVEEISGQPRINTKNKQLLLDKVKREVKDRLNRSLHNARPINLSKEQHTDQVERSWDTEIIIDSKPSFSLPKTTSILEVFDSEETAGKLLILGNPGSGKTTTLLELAQILITRAEDEHSYPIPVLFNLSSWKNDRQPLAEWLVTQLKSKYDFGIELGKKWVENCYLLPLLDGLDELESGRQKLCVEAINDLLVGEQRLQYLIVCSRLEEYKKHKTLLKLNKAIYLQSLTESQIYEYLINIDRTELWQEIQNDANLLELARTPLLLSFINLVYEKISLQDWQELNSRDERLHYLFNAYIKYMLKRDIKNLWYPKFKEPTRKQTLKWLSSIAKKEKKTEFLIENMQPSWLQHPFQKWSYNIVVSTITWHIYGIVFVLSLLLPIMWFAGIRIYTDFGLFTKVFRLMFCCLLVYSLNGVSLPVIRLLLNRLSKLGVLCFSLIAGSFSIVRFLINGLTKVEKLTITQTEEIKLVDSLVEIEVKTERIPTVRVNSSNRTGINIKNSVFSIIWFLGTGIVLEKFLGMRDGILYGVIVSIFIEFTFRWEIWFCRSLSNRSEQELIIKQVIARLIFGLISGIFVGKTYGLVLGLLMFIILSTINVKFGKPQESELISFWLTSPFSTVRVVKLINHSYKEIRVTPNQGIWNSALNARKYAVISGLIVGLITGLYFCNLSGGFIIGLLIGGLHGGLIGGLFFGGKACIQHFTLRVVLRVSGAIPLKYPQFLNYTTERMFLQRVGGHYKFIHELLHKHFAELTPVQVEELSRIDT